MSVDDDNKESGIQEFREALENPDNIRKIETEEEWEEAFKPDK